MAIDCDHPRPPLNLPKSTPPQLGWTVPSFLSNDPLEMRRQLLEALQGVYLEQSRRFATPAVVPLHDLEYDLPPGSVIKGVGNGQVLNLLPPALSGGVGANDPVVVILTGVESPVTVVGQDASGGAVTAVLSVPGVHTFHPDDEGVYQRPPGDTGLAGGVSTDRLLGRDSAGTGEVEEIAVGGGIAFTGTQALALDQALDSNARVGVRLNSAGATPTRRVLNLIEDGAVSIGIADDAGDEEVDITVGVDLSGVTYTAGDGLDLAANEFSVDASDIAGTGLTVSSNNLNVDFSGVTYTAGDGIDLAGLTFSADVSDFAGAGLVDDGGNNLAVGAGTGIAVTADAVSLGGIGDDAILANVSGSAGAVPTERFLNTFGGNNLSYNIITHAFDVDLSGVTYLAGDGLDLLGQTFSADVSDFAGAGLADDGSNNLAVGAGDGIDVFSTTVAVDVSDFAGTGLEDDGSNNLRISSSAAGNGLSGGSGSPLAVNAGAGLEIVSDAVRISTAAAGGGLGGGGGAALFVQSSLDSNARVGVREGVGTTFLRRRISFIEGSNVSIVVSDDAGSEEVDVTIAATDTNTTYTAGDGIDLIGTTFSADVSDFAGAGIEDDGANNLRIAGAAAGNGLTGGGGVALAVGGGDGITVNANDVAVNAGALAGSGLNASSNNLNVDPILDSTARVIVRADSGANGGTRRRINFIGGVGIDITVSDDAFNEEVDVTITATGL